MNCPICAIPAGPAEPHPEVELFRCARCGHRFSRIKPGVSMEPYGAAYFTETHHNWFANPHINLFERIARLIEREPQPVQVIDVGCGNGNFLRYLVGRLRGVALTGVDLMANQATPQIEFIQGDALRAGIHRQFAAVVSLATIEHIDDVRAFVRRLKELTRPSGLVVVMTLNDDSALYLLARALRRVGFPLAFDRLYSCHHIHHFSRRSLAKLLEQEGLRLEGAILHDAPLAAIDIPVSSRAGALLLRLSVAAVFTLGRITRRTYLQTAVCRKG